MNKIESLEKQIYELSRKVGKLTASDATKDWRIQYTNELMPGMYLALCVNTKDPLKRGRIQFYASFLNDPKTDIADLPWANSISTFGGFDDAGSTWTPPASSTVAIIFNGGNRNAPFYLGTVSTVNRGKKPHNWGYEIQEFYDLWSGSRGGYLTGPNDESQVLPPWNTENYNAIDAIQFNNIDDDPDAYKKLSSPHIYGFKTPEKHFLKMVDGNPQCNNMWKRLELVSSRGNWLLFKDDHLHPGGQWAHPSVVGQDKNKDLTQCFDKDGKPIEKTDCKTSTKDDLNKGANPYSKRTEEQRLYKGAPTPANDKCALSQSGIQIQSLSGHQIVLDDSVEQPTGRPRWNKDFDFGCTDKFTGKMTFRSATGHSLELNDEESISGIRSSSNGINLKTAGGINLKLSDHTNSGASTSSTVAGNAGSERGLTIETTSKNLFRMSDEGVAQILPKRKEGGEPIAKATGAYVLTRTGFGCEIKLSDDFSQETTQTQNIQIIVPQKNEGQSPHIFKMQASPEVDKGFILLRAGGLIQLISNGDFITSVGTEDKESNYACSVTGQYVVQAKNIYMRAEENGLIVADSNLYLVAGQDCETKDDPQKLTPCVGPCVVFKNGKLVLSDRVFCSASDDAQKVTLGMVLGT